MHQFQSVAFSTGRPPQRVVGNSGVKLGTADPDGSFTQTVADQQGNGLAFADHGFLDVTRFDATSGAWTAVVIDIHNEVIATCDSTFSGSICTTP
jgi:hypothetical protein